MYRKNPTSDLERFRYASLKVFNISNEAIAAHGRLTILYRRLFGMKLPRIL